MWKKDSWKDYKALHLPHYEDVNHLNNVLGTLKDFPPLVFAVPLVLYMLSAGSYSCPSTDTSYMDSHKVTWRMRV